MNRVIGRGALVCASALALAVAFASPGLAATAPVQSCAHLSGTGTFTPGLTNTPRNQTVTAKGSETGCTPSATTGGSGTLTATIKVANGSCAKLGQGNQKLTGTGTTTWKNKKVSHYTLTFTTGTGSNIETATITGKVASGLFAGHLVTGQIKFKTVGTVNCTTEPVKNITFTNSKPMVIH